MMGSKWMIREKLAVVKDPGSVWDMRGATHLVTDRIQYISAFLITV